MDPNEALRVIRAECHELAKADAGGDDDPIFLLAIMLVEHVRALDEWLSKGGFPPNAWVEPMKRAAVAAQSAGIDPLGPPNPAHGELPPVEHGLDWSDHGSYYTATCHCPKGWTYTAMSMDELLAMYEIHLRKVGVPDHRKAPSRGECTVCGEPVALTEEWFPTTTHAGAPAVRHARDCLTR